MGADVAHQLARQVTNGCEHATGDDLALNPPEPSLNLIQPGRIGRCEVEMHVGMFVEKNLNLAGFVCREVVQDGVDLLFRLAPPDPGIPRTPRRVCRAAVLPRTLPVRTSSAA